MLIKNEVINDNNNNAKNAQTRSELEKELNIQRNHKNTGIIPNITQAEMNQLNYYNEIAKLNTHSIMNNPSLKEVIRVTRDESCLDQLKSKAKLQSKDLPKILESIPLIRVERINYKNIEIGQMRQKLQSNYNNAVDKEKGKEFANNLFSKRLKEGGKYVPIKPVDDLYGQNNALDEEKKKNIKMFKNNKVDNSNEIWTKKYRQFNTIQVTKNMDNMNNDETNRTINTNNDKTTIESIDKSEKDLHNLNHKNTKINRAINNNINNINSYKYKLIDENNNFFTKNKVKSLISLNTDNQIFNSRYKINNFNQFNQEKKRNNIKVPDKKPLIKVNINKQFGNSNYKYLNTEKKSLTSVN